MSKIAKLLREFLADLGHLDAVVVRLQDEYDAPPDRLRDDLLRLVEELRTQGLLEIL